MKASHKPMRAAVAMVALPSRRRDRALSSRLSVAGVRAANLVPLGLTLSPGSSLTITQVSDQVVFPGRCVSAPSRGTRHLFGQITKEDSMNGRHLIARDNGFCSLRSLVLLASLAVLTLGAAPAYAVTLFHETFEGITQFNEEAPENDDINAGLPLVSDGAMETWYGGRFQAGYTGTIDQDLATQKIGGGSNNTHTGRVEDEAGMLFKVDTSNLGTATLSFDWRTFSASSADRLKVGYYVGEIAFGSGRYYDFVADSFFNPLPNNTEANNEGWTTRWTQLLSGVGNTWTSQSYALPVGQQTVWVAFWLDNGEEDYGKFDNVLVTGNVAVPEPGSVMLAAVGAGLCGCVVLRRRFAKRASLRARIAR
jgi:hypothetical protein